MPSPSPVRRVLERPGDLLDLHRLAPTRYPVLLESTASGTRIGRRDLLLAATNEVLELGRDGRVRDAAGRDIGSDFFAALDAAFATATAPHASPVGGWALLIAYEAAGQIERILDLPAAPGSVPVARAVRIDAAIEHDRESGACVLHAVDDPTADRIEADLRRADALDALPAWRKPAAIDEDAPEQFTTGVRRILDYLVAGDVFQANLSRGWTAHFETGVEPAALFTRLRRNNPAPFAGLFSGDGWSVVSASPERLVSVQGDLVETRPIAGTRPRVVGDDDASRVQELVGHPKERAEHVMLIDLERNDLGRVCRAGTVEVDELMTVESYAHVHHIVSNVRGRLREGVTPGEVIRAVFPGGTITGCPKVRCMQIIAELEQVGRGAYTGAMGWLAPNGDMDLNILIRSAEVEGREVRFRTGAGIVADSDPQRELDETRAKARGMLRALGVAD
ncbi:aminodeoxychorismate synthase component I [Lysobacter sp. TY2-98]|uniref:aminodeoxychorismate synthase component I n=1 Tax=Lysobacter sp. TY2-98 TaxID=2290922 RepID=UPI000E1FB6AA|nr:aminodeoxychorismate synthase component I [Lysobacter sp. TY2-98]AXK72316.1 aminodeoxychorismate synthase component I [Lysobacter sp. TY2-98]